MDDQFNTTPDLEPTKSSSGVPTWVWIVGIIVVIAILCPAIICGVLFAIGASLEGGIDSILEEVQSTIEAESSDSSSSSEVPAIGTLVAGDADDETVNLPSTDDEEDVNYDYDEGFSLFSNWPQTEIESDDGSRVEAEVDVADGVYRFTVYETSGTYWAFPGEQFGEGTYEVEIMATEGSVVNSAGIIFGYDQASFDFYYFEIGSDGFVGYGQCFNDCEEESPLIGDEFYYESDAAFQGLNITNKLRVDVSNDLLTFYINGIEVGTAVPNGPVFGDIGVVARSFGEEEVPIIYEFDNFTYRDN